VKEQLMQRRSRTRHATGIPGWGSTPGWDQPLAGWNPLVDHGPPSLRVAGSVARWWWPTLAVTSFLAVIAYVTSHDHPGPSPSNRGLVTIALGALVVILLTIHRTAGPRPLARATAEYTVVALLAALLALAGGVNQQPTNSTGSAAKAKAEHADTPQVDAGEDHRPGVLRVAAGVARAVTTAIRAITGAASWVADLWRQANAKADHPNPSPSTNPKAEAMAPSPAPPLSTRRLL
jgi:hypothetical protein